MDHIVHKVLRFDRFKLDLTRGCLRMGEQEIALRPKAFQLLTYLAKNAGRLVSKQELLDAVWPDVVVSDESLTQSIRQLRQSLGDDAHRVLKTVSRRGYLFDVAVETGEARAMGIDVPTPIGPPTDRGPDHENESAARETDAGDLERRQVTIVACDAIGPAAASACADPEDLREILVACHRCLKEVVERYGGFVANGAASSAIAYFGYPQAHEDDAERAVRAALAAVRAIAALEVGRVDTPLQPRVSIATGLVLVGDRIGPDRGDGPIVVGAAAHVVTRLLAVAEAMAVVVSAETRRLIGDLFECADIDPAALGGVGAPLTAVRIVRESSIASRFDALRPHRTQLVGRDEELELLRRRWHQARTGKGRVVLLSGEAGIGKSRLVRALREELADESHTPILYYCSPHHQDSALYPITRQLQHVAGIAPEDGAPARLGKLGALLAQSGASVAEDVPLFAALLAIPAEGRYPPPDLTPRRMKERTLEAILRGFKRLAEHRPVLLVFEDLQWVDPTSLELLSAAIDQASGLPILVVATARPELVLPWALHRHVSTIHLGQLGQSEGEMLVKDVGGGKALAPEVIDRIVAHADGVPLFIEELTKTVLESGILRDAGDCYELIGPLPQPSIPPTLYASLVARLDRLASVKDVAQIGAAIGREFSYGLLAAVAPQSERDLREALQQLAKAELVFQRGAPPDARYLFKHALVQDAAYASLPRGRRQQLHDAIGHALEQRFPDIVAAEPEILAHHFAEAGLEQTAIGYWLKAGQVAGARWANMEAISHLKKGVALLPALPEDLRLREELKLQCALGPALSASEGYAAELTVAAFERARALMDMTGDFSNLDFVMEGLTAAYYNGANYKECLRHREEFLMIAERDRDPFRLCIAHRGIASVHNVFANFEQARAHADRAWNLYNSANHGPHAWRYVRDVGVSALCHRAIAEWHLGHPERSRALMARSCSLAESSKHPNTIGYAHGWAGMLCFMFRDWVALQRHATTLTSLGREQGLPHYVSWGTCLEAPPLAATGAAEAAVEMARAGLALRERIQARGFLPVFLYLLAECQHLAQRHAEALAVIAEAMAIADRTGERWIDAELWRLKGDAIGAADGRCAAADAEKAYRQAMAVASAQGANMFALRAATSLACHLAATCRKGEGRGLLAPLYAAFAEGFDTPDLKAARALLVRLA